MVVTFFVTQEHGLLLQDSQPKPATLLSLLALDTPYYYYICKVQTHWNPSFPSSCFSVNLYASLFLIPLHTFFCISCMHRFISLILIFILTVLLLLSSYFGGEDLFSLMWVPSQSPSGHLAEESSILSLFLFSFILLNLFQKECLRFDKGLLLTNVSPLSWARMEIRGRWSRLLPPRPSCHHRPLRWWYGEPSETLWDWRAVRSRPETPCWTSASTSL